MMFHQMIHGDFYTVASYDEERYGKDIPNIGKNNVRASDTIDFRPRVTRDILVMSHHLHSKIDFLVHQVMLIHHLLLLQMKVQ